MSLLYYLGVAVVFKGARILLLSEEVTGVYLLSNGPDLDIHLRIRRSNH